MEYGLIGEHLPHSFSKEIHGRLASYTYELCELTPAEVGPFMERADFSAINVTIPYKETVMPYLDEIHDTARLIGSVNTVVKRGGRLIGYNTDFFGLSALLRHIGIDLADKKVLILGTGGTARTARAVARAKGARCVLTVSRHSHEEAVSYAEATALHSDAEVLINTTPCGMFPYSDGGEGIAGCPIDISLFPRLSGVVDAVYNPLRTNLVLNARARGIAAEGGLYMLVAQAAVASRIFLGEEPETIAADPATSALTERVFREIAAEKENIVLTGMPSSGKSTVGRLLAEQLGRPFFDTDEEIVRRAGENIPRLFAERGEAAFRELEREVIRELAATEAGAVIATGGGAILSVESVRALSRTGRIYFLDRPYELLLPTDDRPLSATAEMLRMRYIERYPRYLATSDVTVPNLTRPEDAAELIRKDLFL